MNAILKFSITLSILLFVFVGGFLTAGLLQNAEFKGSKTEVIPANVEQVWDYLSDFPDWKNRRKEIISIEILEADAEKVPLRWKQKTSMNGFLLFERGDFIPNQKLETKIIDSSFQLTGRWVYTLEPQGNTTRVTLTEESKINSPMIRGAYLFSGRDTNLKQEIETVLNHFLR